MAKIKLTLDEYKQQLSVIDKRLYDCFCDGSFDDYKTILEERNDFISKYGVIGTEVRDIHGEELFDLDV